MSTNDNESGTPIQMLRPSDARGQAALILVESLIHGLIARSVLTTEASLEIVTSAVDVQADYADEAVDGLALEMRHSQVLLSAIADSLRIDIAPSARRPTRPTLVDVNEPPTTAPLRPDDRPREVDGIDE